MSFFSLWSNMKTLLKTKQKVIGMKKNLIIIVLSACLLTGCSSKSEKENNNQPTVTSDKDISHVSYLDIAYGKDYTDLKADIIFLTSRSDLIADTDAPFEFPDYLREFNKVYPDINVFVEAATDYDFDINNRLVSGNWGEVCSIPNGVESAMLGSYFEPYATIEELEDKYHAVDTKVYQDIVYGLPSGIDVQGIVYNKKVWADAGITELPKTPEQFLTDLQLIKDNTDAVPLYTNYNAGWPLVNWDFQAVGSGVGVDNYMNDVMLSTKRPFVQNADGTGLYAVYQLLYDCVRNQLTEEDPHSSSWELCKGRINNGEIGCMVLGSWAISQMQTAGGHGDDISYMPFPISIHGKQYALASSNYCYGISKDLSDEKRLASMIFVKYLVEKSKYDFNNSSIPVVKTNEYPDILGNFDGVNLVTNTTISEEFEKISRATVGVNYDSKHLENIVDAALNGDSFDELMDNWNDAWEAALLSKE